MVGMATKKPKDLIHKYKAAQVAGISRQAIHDAIKRGALPVHKITVTITEEREFVSRAELRVYMKRVKGKAQSQQ